jgi:FAD/FMN-containing dehydrogenase
VTAVAAAAPGSTAELAELLRTRPGRVRLLGGGSRQDTLPPPPAGTLPVRLDGLRRIVRLDAADQTCVVECGVRVEQLADALRPHGLELPCGGSGTLGGLFASDPCGALTFAGPSPRSLLLGLDGLLADGTAFRSGARVVKSVAGFDVHGLLVGSRGRLFVATQLFLRLRARARASRWFAQRGLEPGPALALVTALRRLPVAPAVVQLQREHGAFTVCGRVDGRPAWVDATTRALGLTDAESPWRERLDAPAGVEVLCGNALPSALPALLAALPDGAPMLWHGGGRFLAAIPDAVTADAVLDVCARIGVAACVERGAPARRGTGTPIDAGQQRIADGLRNALDPDGVLC